MNDLKEEIKKSVLTAQETGNKFVEDPLWESQAWFLRTRVRFGNDYQQFWDHTQGQINDYVTDLNSEDQIQARAEVAESFTLALKTGFDDCNKQMDMLLQKVFQVNRQIEDDDNNKNNYNNHHNSTKREEPEIISLLDMEDDSVDQRVQVDPPSKFDAQTSKKADPEPTSGHTVTSSIVAVLEENITEDDDDDFQDEESEEPHLQEEEEEQAPSEAIDAAIEEVNNEVPSQELDLRNDRLEVATPHRTVDPEITNLVDEEPLDIVEESSPEVIDLTHNHEEEEETTEIVEIVNVDDHEIIEQVDQIEESPVGQHHQDTQSNDDYDDQPTPSHSRSLSLTEILLATYCEDIQDSPERAQWFNDSVAVLSTIVSRDTDDDDDEYHHDDEPTIETMPSKTMELISALGLSSLGAANPAAPESADAIDEGREGSDDSERDVQDAERGGTAEGSRMEPIDLTQV